MNHKMYNWKLLLKILIIFTFSMILSNGSNCTENCLIRNIHHYHQRKWPKFDFDFYYETNNDNNNNHSLINNSLINDLTYTSIFDNQNNDENSFISTESTTTRPIILIANHSTVIYVDETEIRNHTNLNSNNGILHKNFTEITSLEDDNLLKISFIYRNDSIINHWNKSDFIEYFQDKLSKLYEMEFKKHSNGSINETIELDIRDVIIDDKNERLEIKYEIKYKNNDTIIPFENVNQLMSSISNDQIHNLTGFNVIDKLENNNKKNTSTTVEANRAEINWINFKSMLIVLGTLFLLFILLLCLYCFCCRFNNENRHNNRWIETINQEIIHHQDRRLSANNNGINTQSESIRNPNNNNFNSVASSTDDLIASSTSSSLSCNNNDNNEDDYSVKKLDKSQQYDYLKSQNLQTFPKRLQTLTSSYSDNISSGSSKQKFIPIHYNFIDRHSSDINNYDRISYIHSRETIKETHKHPNILEIKLNEETQSIVKEIRKELNRFNQRKILNDDCSTSEA